eukprot:5981171-Heterocapsa_arctica.AAC.1
MHAGWRGRSRPSCRRRRAGSKWGSRSRACSVGPGRGAAPGRASLGPWPSLGRPWLAHDEVDALQLAEWDHCVDSEVAVESVLRRPVLRSIDCRERPRKRGDSSFSRGDHVGLQGARVAAEHLVAVLSRLDVGELDVGSQPRLRS